MQPVSALESTAQPQPFAGHTEKNLKLLGTLGISNMVDVLEHHGVLFISITPLQMAHLTAREIGALVQSSTAVGTSQPLR